MRKIELRNGLRSLVDDDDFEKVSAWKWSLKCGYACRSQTIDGKLICIYLHRFLLQPAPHEEVDHINGNILDNRRSNLRVCVAQQNGCNRKIGINNKSGYKGVHFRKDRGKWNATIKFLGKTYYCGLHGDKEDAANAYNKKAIQLHGEFARLNTV